MHRARLAEKAGAEMREHVVRGEQHAVESLHGIALVARMRTVIGKSHRIRNFVGHGVDAHVYAEPG
jgi:hypothetical protein